MKKEKEKTTQFECGFNFMNPTHTPFSFQFFLIAVLFLIFDIEISILTSYPLESIQQKGKLMTFGFITTLTIGLIYEWQKSKIDWSKWTGSLPLQGSPVKNPDHLHSI